MVRTALHPNPVAGTPVSAQWVEGAAGRIVAAMEERRSTWQIWHVQAEAQRQVRAAPAPAGSERAAGRPAGRRRAWKPVGVAGPA